MNDTNPIRRFFRTYEAAPVGATPELTAVPPADPDDVEGPAPVELDVEVQPDQWAPKIVGEAPAEPGESPVRFIDGSLSIRPVLSLRAPQGWPIALVVGDVGAVCLRLQSRKFTREFRAVERVVSFVAHPFPWAEVEALAGALADDPGLALRLLPANMPDLGLHNPFDYEVMRSRARARAQQEMTTLERLALAVDRLTPTLVDGPLNRVTGEPDAAAPLLVGVAKTQSTSYLHEQGWRTLLTLGPSQRTPVFRIAGLGGGRESDLSVASWYLKFAGGPRLAPNWGYVRVEVPWVQFEEQFRGDFGFVDRLSRWLIDARCRQESYARMPVSLEPIVRAEEGLKPLFTPLPVLMSRLYRSAGLFRSNEL